MIDFLLPFTCFFLCFSAVGGVVFALVLFLDWLCDFLRVRFQSKEENDGIFR